MVVGDALQSIYGFRHADLDAYREQRAAIEGDPDGRVIELTGNFRSGPEVIGAVNALGERLIGDDYQTAAGRDRRPRAAGRRRPRGRAAADRTQGLGGARPRAGRRLRHATPLSRRVALPRRAPPRPRRREGSAAARWSSCCAPSPTSTRMRTRWPEPACAPTSSAAAATGPSSRSPTPAPCWPSIANPLDDQALFGALASPACGVSPDTLWLLRPPPGRSATSGRRWRRRRVSARPSSSARAARADPRRDIAPAGGFAETVPSCGSAGPELPLAELIDRSLTATGYDLAVLSKPAGEARFANLRKLMQIADEFEGREGRDLRGLLDFLAFREEAADESAASTAAEDHDGVRIMSVHRGEGPRVRRRRRPPARPQPARRRLGAAADLRPRRRRPGRDAAAPTRAPARSTSSTTRRCARRTTSAMPTRACGSSTSPPRERGSA